MNNLWIFSIEPISSRYTIEWHTTVPALLKEQLPNLNVIQIDGKTMPGVLQNGEFLDFASTNMWKNEQANEFLQSLRDSKVQKGDHVLFLDAWNPIIPEIKYVSELRGINLTLHGLFHAGSWDSEDFLGRLIGDSPWVRNLERSYFHCLNHSYFATHFHAQMFVSELFDEGKNDVFTEYSLDNFIINGNIVITGFPFEYLRDIIQKDNNGIQKENIILFPHRIAPEKQVEIFKDLAASMPQYRWIVCQEQNLTKEEYHKLLLRSKMVFSANLQETLGISSCSEAPITGTFPLTPNRLSYSEIFQNHSTFLYPSEWTKTFNDYVKHKDELIERINLVMSNFNTYDSSIQKYLATDYKKYFHADNLIKKLKSL